MTRPMTAISNEISNLLKPQKLVKLNPMQMAAVLANHRYKIPYITIEAARGSGKSTVLGWFVKEAVRQMPRSTGVIVGETFVQIKSRTLPSTKEGMEMFGLYEDIDYVVGRCGKKEGFEMPFQAPDDRKELVFEYYGYLEAQHMTDSSNKGIGLAYIEIRPMRQHTIEGNVIPYVFNFNRVNLKKAVPDMSFGDLVTIIKNWRNYDLTFDGSKAVMNLIRIDKMKEPEDFRAFEVENPIRKFTDKEYFHLKFPEVEGMENRNIFFNESGYQLNPAFVPENTTEITINGFCLPMAFFRGANTAKACKESSLMLVYYAGLDRDGDNHATNPKGLEGEECAEHLKHWYMNRLSNFSYKWTFITEKNKIRKYDIRSEIFAYNKRHWIKSWVKNSISDKHYSIEIETETY